MVETENKNEPKKKKGAKKVILVLLFLIVAIALIIFGVKIYETTTTDDPFEIVMNSRITFEDGTSEGEVNLVNDEQSEYIQVLTISLEDSDEEIYSSDAINPGDTLETITLEEDLEKGRYNATATSVYFDATTFEKTEISQKQIKIIVEN